MGNAAKGTGGRQWGAALRRMALCAVLCAVAVSMSGCAVLDEDHRMLTNVLNEFIPEEMPMNLVSAPLWIPAGIVTLFVDGLILNPIFNVPEALDDAGIAFTAFGWLGPVDIVLLPVRAVVFVPIFIGSDILRCSIPYIW